MDEPAPAATLHGEQDALIELDIAYRLGIGSEIHLAPRACVPQFHS